MTYRHIVFQSVYKLGTRRIIAAHSIIHVRKNVAASGLIMNTVYSNLPAALVATQPHVRGFISPLALKF